MYTYLVEPGFKFHSATNILFIRTDQILSLQNINV